MKIYRQLSIVFILLIYPFFLFGQIKNDTNKLKDWFPKYDFNPAFFQNPSHEFAPFARWWWPGNAVTKEELKREIKLFAENGFGGVEIQPLNLFVPGTKEVQEKVNTWDSPEYYENVKTVMEEARKYGLMVDMTDGSGWPPAGLHLSAEDGFKSLNFAAVDVKGGEKIHIAVPKVKNNTDVSAKLISVNAYKLVPKNEKDKSITELLESSTYINLTRNVTNDSLLWNAPVGNWKIIAFWCKASGEKGMTAASVQGYVMDHFDSTKVLKNFNYLFGERTGLLPYFGNPMRSIFDDSYEFKVDRHFSQDFISYFKQKRGYDITAWLPAQMENKYNYVAFMRPPNTAPDFSFSKNDWRLRYDYDFTLSELFGEHFLKTSKNWMESKGLLHRTQIYGLKLNIISLAGLASIPETETMNGSELNLKIMSSGAHLNNRPVISAESVVYNGMAYTNTPQKLKLSVDKLFASGINQIVYHGVPYRYTPTELGQEGWFPFSTPLMQFVNFSSNLGEGNIFWKYQKDINEYVNRTQYALRSGKPHADVLIYVSFFDMNGMPSNPEEIFTNGYIEDIDGASAKNNKPENQPKNKWSETIFPLINQLEARGITWDWVNDEAIQSAKLTKGKEIDIQGNHYQALILATDSIIQLKTAEQINNLASKGMNLMVTGSLKFVQPSYLNWQENDKKTNDFILSALKSKNSKYIKNEAELSDWMKKLNLNVAFNEPYRFTRQVQREMSDGSQLRFFWNKSNQWQTLSLTLDKKFTESYWMNSEDGTILKNKSSVITYQIPPYGSVILLASTRKLEFESKNQIPVYQPDKSKEILSIEKWNLKADSIDLKNISLFDWRTNEQLKFSSAEGVYSAPFQWNTSIATSHYYLDLGKVCSTAEVYVNGKFAGKRIFSPYILDITAFLQQGTNNIEIRVITNQLNGFIGKANQGDTKYKQFKGKENQLLPAGLLGPVVIKGM
ncbi:MAG: glycosyl hydrolase [Bacteroidales bacterium]